MKKENMMMFALSLLSAVSLYFYFSPNGRPELAWSAFLPVWFAVVRADRDKTAVFFSFFPFTRFIFLLLTG